MIEGSSKDDRRLAEGRKWAKNASYEPFCVKFTFLTDSRFNCGIIYLYLISLPITGEG